MNKPMWLVASLLVPLLMAASCASVDPPDTCRLEVRENLNLCLQSANSPKLFLRQLCRDEYEEQLHYCS